MNSKHLQERRIPGPVGPQGPQGPIGPKGEPGDTFIPTGLLEGIEDQHEAIAHLQREVQHIKDTFEMGMTDETIHNELYSRIENIEKHVSDIYTLLIAGKVIKRR